MKVMKKIVALLIAVVMVLPVLTVNSFAVALPKKVEIVKVPTETTFVKGIDWDYGYWKYPEGDGFGVFTPDNRFISLMYNGGYFSRYQDRGMLNMNGLVVKATYPDGTVKTIEYKETKHSNGVITQNIYFSPKGGEFKVGENTIEVYFMDGNIFSEGYATYKINIVEKGDLNSDTKVNSADALLVLQHSVESISLSEAQQKVADMNSDSKINSMDALMILQKSVGVL